MKILIIGSGGREHAIGWKLMQSPLVQHLYFCPGNAGTALLGENIPMQDFESLAAFCIRQQVSLTVVGPEVELVNGIVDVFQSKGLNVFGADKKSARLESDKAYAKEIMNKYGIKTAMYRSFNNPVFAKTYLETHELPVVVKASGLAAGKGVVICQNLTQAHQAIDQIMIQKIFGDSGNEVVIEEFLEGFEASILSIYNGKNIYPMVSAKDHKKIGEGETGLNTGGMGVVAPNPLFTDDHNHRFHVDILEPTLRALEAEQLIFAGVIFFGLMITTNGVYLLEYNTRFGDPETQAILPLLESDLYEVFQNAISGKALDLKWKNQYSVCVVLTAPGYPKEYAKNLKIDDLTLIQVLYFVAGAQIIDDQIVTTGGRVLNIVSIADTVDQARVKVYQNTQHALFPGMYFRKDIGLLSQ